MAIKTKYVEPKAYMSKEMERAFNAAVKKSKETKQPKKTAAKKKGK